MSNGCEILATVHGDATPKTLQFSELYDLRDSLQSIMLLWNNNSYYVDALSKTFIVNGGRRIRFAELGTCKILYRRRNRVDVSVDGGEVGRSVSYLIGLRETVSDRKVFVKVSEDGFSWEWGSDTGGTDDKRQ